MVTLFQISDWPSGRIYPRRKYIGSFFSVESAEAKLGWFFVSNCCEIYVF